MDRVAQGESPQAGTLLDIRRTGNGVTPGILTMNQDEETMTDPRDEGYLAILGAVDFETNALLDHLHEVRSFPLLDSMFHSGLYGGWSIIIGSTGLGKVNAAIITATLLDRFSIRMVWNVGCAGGFEEGPLAQGDVLVASTTICGDEGVLTGEGASSVASIGIPILLDGETKYFDHIPLSRQAVMDQITSVTPEGLYHLSCDGGAAVHVRGMEREARSDPPLSGAGARDSARREIPIHSHERAATIDSPSVIFRLRYGPSLTVGMASGDKEVARNRFMRYGGWAENMEGSGVAQACFRFRVPMVECRGISNIVGNRNKGDWRLQESLCHCHGIILDWLRRLTPLSGS